MRLTFGTPSVRMVLAGAGMGAILGLAAYVVATMWLRRAEDGEFEPEDSEVVTTLGHPHELTREHLVAKATTEKPAMSELVRDTKVSIEAEKVEPVGDRTDYASKFEEKGEEMQPLTLVGGESFVEEDDIFEDDGDGSEGTVLDTSWEDEETVVPMRNRPVIPKYVREAMNKRYEVITESSYNGDEPYNDKYTATYFIHDGILGGFDGDIRPVADELLEAMAFEGIAVGGAEHLFLRDREGDSDFHITRSDEDFDTAFAEMYGEGGDRT